MEIREIRLDNINIKRIEIPVWNFNDPSATLYVSSPATINIGVPVINMPGCVEAHETNNSKNNQVSIDDANGLVTYCDSGYPSFNPIQFEPEQMIMTGPPAVGGTKPDKPKPPQADTKTPPPPSAPTAKIECPTKVQVAQEPVGTFVEGFRKKVTGYELIDKTCVQIKESVGIPTQIIAGLPSGGQVMQVGGIAVIATTSALLAKPLADILLKVVKPTVKKVIKKIDAIRGKEVKVLSLRERQVEQRHRNQAIRVLKSALKPKG
jgi:hypothetical protein